MMAAAEAEQGIRAMELVQGHEWKEAIPILDTLIENNNTGQGQWLAARTQCHMQLGSTLQAAKDCASLLKYCCRNNTPLPEAGLQLLTSARSTPHSLDLGLAPLLKQLQNRYSQEKLAEKLDSVNIKDTKSIVTEDCVYCARSFPDRAALRAHCATEMHQRMIMSDEGRDWKWRPPPRGFTSDTYALCENWELSKSHSNEPTCAYGAQCVEAHGADELAEWKERFEYRKMKLQRASEKELYGKSYTEMLLEKWVQATSPEKVMREKLETVEETCSAELVTTVSSKVSKREWTFVLKSKRMLKAVALLQDAHRNHFILKQVFPGEPKPNKKGRDGHKIVEADLTSDQEWISSHLDKTSESEDGGPTLEHRVKVVFSTDIYGTFRQSVVFDFGVEPVLVKHLCVDVVPVTDMDKIKEVCEEMKVSVAERWDGTNTDIVAFSSPVYPGLSTPYGKDSCSRDKELLNAYAAPRANNLCLTQTTVTEKRLTKNNYRTRMHELLYVEEIARCEQVVKFNVACKLHVAPSYILAPSGMATSTAKYAHSGELFAQLPLGSEISEDTSAGRLILNNCTTILFSASPYKGAEPRRVYEAFIEDKGKRMIYLRLSAISVQELGIKPDTDFQADIQFQLNRLTFCEWHYAIDKIGDYSLVFPDTVIDASIPWSPHHQWKNKNQIKKLNVKQKEAVQAITCPTTAPIPPILIIGPFGTGKTFTLAQAIKHLILESDSKILICTHSNSAADLYIKDYLHPWVEEGITDAKPLRVYYHKRWVTTVDQVVQKYCLIELNNGVRNFRLPNVEDILKHRIVVVTLSISMYLATLGLPKGFFTHILLDEAAQAMESEALMPLALATPSTRIVLAGDHMQLSPELFSQFAKERNLHISLLERLYEHYPTNFPCKILLCENYRAHDAIISFTSELFYEQMLIASGKQPAHEKFYPLTFFTTRGEDVQDQNSTAFYNNSEVYEVVERISELKKRWPAAWGKIDEHSIGIMTPYADQVFRIRSELRKRRMGGISVERVLNVQGKQFRAVFLSTVRTRRTCQASSESDYGFLSNRKLLNTAITRAQSLVAVVGDPIALCSIGRCRKVWERFISICNDNKSLFGISWSMVRSQLDGVELKKTYTLNPLAKEFIPRAMQKESYLRLQTMPGIPMMAPMLGPPLQMSVNQMNPNLRPNMAPQIPPIMGAANPILPYPMFFLNQPNTQNMFPINHPNAQPQAQIQNIPMPFNQPVNTPVNPWGNMMTSPNGRNTPTWPMKQMQKKTIIPTMNAQGIPQNHQVIQNTIPQRQNIIPSHVLATGLTVQNKSHAFLPLPPVMTKHPSPETSPVTQNVFPQENFIQNTEVAPSQVQYFRNAQLNMPQERIHNFLPSHNKFHDISHPPSVAHDKDHIQFLQNVHFPERTQIPTNNTNIQNREMQPLLQQSHLNMQDICNENQDMQSRNQWYSQTHMMDAQAIENVIKLTDTMNQRNTISLQPKPPPQQSLERYLQNDFNRVSEEMFTEQKLRDNSRFRNYNNDDGVRHWNMDHQMPNNSMNKHVNKEIEPFLNFHGNSGIMQGEKVAEERDQRDLTSDYPWLFRSSAQSVPLYRRQAGQANTHHNNQPMQNHSIAESLEKQNSTGAFAGYARAFSMQQSESSNNIHPPQMMNGNMNNSNLMYSMVNPQQRLHPQHIPLPHTNGHSADVSENDVTTYASVLRQTTPKLDEDKNDPFMMLREFSQKPQQQPQPRGLYNYFN